MERPSPWVLIVVLLLGALFVREPRLQRSEQIFLRWLLRNSRPPQRVAPLTIVEMGAEAASEAAPAKNDSTEKFERAATGLNSSLEAALFLQAVLEFKPTVVVFESVLKWPDR